MTDGALDAVTAGLAVATVAMAWQTRRLAGSSQRTLQAEHEPVVLADTRDSDHHSQLITSFQCHGLKSGPVQPGFPVAHVWIEYQTMWLVVRVRNVGRGTAIVRDVLHDAWIDLGGQGHVFGECSAPAFAPSDTGYVVFADQPNVADNLSMNAWITRHEVPFTVNLRYFDLDGQREFRALVRCTAGMPPRIARIYGGEVNPRHSWWRRVLRKPKRSEVIEGPAP